MIDNIFRKRHFTLFAFIIFVFPLYSVNPSTPTVVELFYQTMKGLANAPNDSYAYDYREKMKICFRGNIDSGISVPNDFYDWGIKKGNRTTSNQYANLFYDLSYRQKILKLDKYTIGASQYVSEVDLKKYRIKSNDYIQTIVTKTFRNGQITKTFVDTLIVERGEIVSFRNSVSFGEEEDIEALRALAASYYTSKKYYSAYKTYEKIIKIDPQNANAYYRLGLMTFWTEGCYFGSKKVAHKKGIELVEKSLSLGFHWEKGNAALYYMKHSQPI